MKRFARLFSLLAAIALAFSVLSAVGASLADARPGGGSSFRSGSSSPSRSSSSPSRSSGGSYGGGYSGGYGSTVYYGGGGGDGSFVGFLVLVILVVILVAIIRSRARREMTDWHTVGDGEMPPQFRRSPRSILQGLSGVDPNFSLVVFEDFIYALYTEVQTARGRGQAAKLTAYLGPSAVAGMNHPDLSEVKTIVIGAMRIVAATEPSSPNDAVRTTIELESNYTEVSRSGREQAFYALERWSLVRRAGVLSRTPQKARIIACPNCGAPLDGVISGRCRYCNTDVCTGGFDWVVEQIDIGSKEPRGPMLTEETREEGTNLPSVVDRGAAQLLQSLAAGDAAFQWPTIEQRIAQIFGEFQRAWSGRDLASMRSLMSETLFQTQTYWIQTYVAQGLRNVTENARIDRIELARVSSDQFFDSVTVRLFARSLDYTVSDKDGKVVVGSKSSERAYSEYWTIIRGRAQPGASSSTDGKACPNCGAPLTVNMAGKCTYCKATVSSGEFDWVLSRIEQDEVYTG